MRACTRQPIGLVQVDPSFGASAVWVPSLGNVDLVSGKAITLNSVASRRVGARGIEVVNSGADYTKAVQFYSTGATYESLFIATGATGTNGSHYNDFWFGNPTYGLRGDSTTNMTMRLASSSVLSVVTAPFITAYASFKNTAFVLSTPGIWNTNTSTWGNSTPLATVGALGNLGMSALMIVRWDDKQPSKMLVDKLHSNPWQLFTEPQWLYTGMGSGSYTPLEVTG